MANKFLLFLCTCFVVASCDSSTVGTQNDGDKTYVSPIAGNYIEYEGTEIPDARSAAFFVLADRLRETDGLTVGPPLPASMAKDGGGKVETWEVSLYSEESGHLEYTYAVEVESRIVHLICDRSVDPGCS